MRVCMWRLIAAVSILYGLAGCDDSQTAKTSMGTTGVMAGAATQAGGSDQSGETPSASSTGTDGGANVSAGTPSAGTPSAGTPSAGTPSAGTPSAGTPSAGMANGGAPVAGTPSGGQPSAGTPNGGASNGGTPNAGDMNDPPVGGVPIGEMNMARDQDAPQWAQGAAMFAERIEADKVLLAWSNAIDTVGVTMYRLYRDGAEIAQVPANQTNYVAAGLLDGTQYTFGVLAEDAAGNRSVTLSVTVTSGDDDLPTWANNAMVRALDIEESSVTLTWPSARDNVGVTRYMVMLNGNTVTETEENTARLDDLMPLTRYRVEVVAVDGAGNTSIHNPFVEFTTVDTTAPQFAAGATLMLHDATPRQVRVSWQAAIDNVDVAGYEVSLDGAQLGRVDANTLTYTIDGLRAGTRVTATVRAYDSSGNMSDDGPAATFDTGDDTPPTWPAMPSLRASEVTANSLILAWSPALDDVAVTTYIITQNGQIRSQSAVPQLVVNELSPWTDYTFTVRAQDALGNASVDTLSLDIQTPDNQAPGWSAGDQLTTSNVSPTGVSLTWPMAQDDVSVVAYDVFQDNVLLGRVNGQTTQYDVGALRPWTEYTFRVQAVDQADNTSTIDLTVTQRTADEGMPIWPNGALTVTNVTPSSLRLKWPAAQDDVGIVAYVVSQDGEEIARTDGAMLTVDVNELSPWTDYTFAVSALDLAGNMSVQPLSVMQRTPDNQAPAFPAGGSLTIVNLTSTSATVRWPAATDDVGVHRYAVALDGAPQPSLGGQAIEIRLDQLRAMRAYLVTVRAYDAADNPSGELATTINTPDGGPPTWGNGRLTGTAGINEAVLVWDAAVDDVAVTVYRVFQGQAQVYEGADRQYRADSLAAETSYTFRVEAGDAAGNWSSDGPTTTLTTAKAYDPGFKRLTKAQYTRTISDLFGQLWEDRYAARIALGFDEGFSTHNTSEANFDRLMTQNWGYANLYRTTYPADRPIPGADTPRGGFKRLDAVVHAEHVASWVGVVMYHTSPWSTWLGAEQAIQDPCEFEFNNDLRNAPDLSTAYRQCVMELIDEFAPRALRRPITPEERDEFIGVYDEIPQVYADQNLNDDEILRTGVGHVLAVIALQPEVSYQVEVGDDNGRLTAYELASRLSYHFWNTMPDDALFAAAADGSLMTEQGYATQVERLFNDPRSDRALREFYADFFRTDSLHDLTQQDAPAMPSGGSGSAAYHEGPNVEAGPIPTWNNTQGLYNGILGSMQSELINLGRYFTQLSPGTFEEMFRSNLHLMECNNPSYVDQSECNGAGPYAQAIYGIDGDCIDFDDCAERSWTNASIGWDGVSVPIEIPDDTRVGLITRMAFLGHDTYQARPIRRGLLIREMLLCDPIPPPENCDVVQPPSLSGRCTDAAGVEGDDCTGDAQCGDNETCVGWDRSVTMTVREKVEELTEQPNTSCVQCHSTLINGFGHALGHFSSLGKYWETEHMFTTQRNANDEFWYFGATPDQWQPIDTASSTIMNGRVVQFDGAQDVADILVDSGQMEWCWSREYFRYAMGRIDWESDADTIEAMAQDLRDGGTLDNAFKAIVYTPQFRSLYKVPHLAVEGGGQ